MSLPPPEPTGPPTPHPLVFAHRGASAELPEHTLAAYQRALADGADGLECDVRMTRDGHLVCVHDRRLERTSNGTGRVSAWTLAELTELDFGSWHRPEVADDPLPGPPIDPPVDPSIDPPLELPPAPPPDPDRTRLLTLDSLLHVVRDAGRRIELLIETKHPSRYGSGVERRLVATLARHGLVHPSPDELVRVTVMSFSPLALRQIRRLAPMLPTVLLLEMMPIWPWRTRLPFGTRIAGPGIDLVRARPGLIPALRAAGNQVYVWTVNTLVDLDLVLDQGVDGVITDRPALALRRLGR